MIFCNFCSFFAFNEFPPTWFTVILVHDPVENAIPAGGGGHLKEKNHALAESLEIVHFVQRPAQLHCHEETHAKDGKYKHHKEEKEADVEEGGHGHGKGKE